MTSLLASIRAAVSPGAAEPLPDDPSAGAIEPGAATPVIQPAPEGAQHKETDMSNGSTPGASLTDADLAKATADGEAKGLAAANTRLGAILGADGIKGDGKRMAAALDLAMGSPAMTAEAVTAFVTANVTALAAPDAGKPDAAAAYEQERLATAGLATPAGGTPAAGKPKGTLSATAIFESRRQATKGA
jgi:hypothetical protein